MGMTQRIFKLTRHLWYAYGTTAGAVAPRGQSFNLDEVVLSRRDLQLQAGLIGFQYGGPAVPVLTIHNLEEREDPGVSTSFSSRNSPKLKR